METCKFCDREAHYKATHPQPPYSSGETVFVCPDHYQTLIQDLTSMGLLDPISPLAIVEQIWHPPPPAPLLAPLTGDEAYELRLELEKVKGELQQFGIVKGELQKTKLDCRDLQAQLDLKDALLAEQIEQIGALKAELREKTADTIPPGPAGE